MNIKKLSGLVLAGVIAISVVGCSSTPPNPVQNPSGFLPDYKSLQLVPNTPAGTQVYTYKNPNVSRGDYHGVIIAPVQLYQTASKDGVTNDQIQAAKTSIQNGITEIVSQQMPLVTQPGTGVATLSVAITGAQVQGEGFKPWNLIPISAAITLASNATGTNSKTPFMVVEIKVVDSVSGELLRETLTTISGESFRNQANTPQEFDQLAQTWVSEALKYTSS